MRIETAGSHFGIGLNPKTPKADYFATIYLDGPTRRHETIARANAMLIAAAPDLLAAALAVIGNGPDEAEAFGMLADAVKKAQGES
jgi:hypothetical protein